MNKEHFVNNASSILVGLIALFLMKVSNIEVGIALLAYLITLRKIK